MIFAQREQSKSIVAVFCMSISETMNWILLKYDIEREFWRKFNFNFGRSCITPTLREDTVLVPVKNSLL